MNYELILMSCCAPCSAGAVKELARRPAAVLFYNPNIYPRAEYDRRLGEQKKLCEKYGVEFVEGPYDHNAWRWKIKGSEAEPERGERCEKCFEMRAKFGISWVREHGCRKIASVFGTSKHKDQSQVDAAFSNANDAGDIEYKKFDFEYAPEAWMYRQKYCGCEFSETYHEND